MIQTARRSDGEGARATRRLARVALRLALLAAVFCVSLGAATSARAENCSDYPGGILDGFAGGIAPSQIQVDRNCIVRNFPASNPMSTNFSFKTQPGQTDERWIIIFDNVVHTGQMSCNAVAGHIIWFTNGSSTSIQEGCQNFLIPVEKIDKQNPAGTTTATVGVPFTYTLTSPVLFDPGSGTVINSQGSPNQLHSVELTDDLNEAGVDLTYISHTATFESSGAPVPHTFSNVGGLLTFTITDPIPAGEQVIIALTVVLDDTPTNSVGTQFVNLARWEFGRLIDGEFFEPLPGENGITEPLTIAAPDLVATKTGPATLNLGVDGDFTIDIRNDGTSDAWDVTITDQLPDGPTGGMCDTTPTILSARVFAADGVTPVPGKGPLGPGDFSFSYAPAPTCELALTMQSAEAAIAPGERLIVRYQTALDSDTDDGVALTNVAGATSWFNGAASNPARIESTRTLTNGTVGTLDHEDAHTVNTLLTGFFYEKTPENLTLGINPTTSAQPGDVLRYTLRLQATDASLLGVTFSDDLGSMNPTPVFVPGSLAIVPGSLPPGADASSTDPNGGTNGQGLLVVRNLNAPLGTEVSIQFDVTVAMGLLDGTVITNQSNLIRTVPIGLSDDPNVNGQADPDTPGDEDPTRVVVAVLPPDPLLKENSQATASIGEAFTWRVTIPSVPHVNDLYDVRILDDLTAAATGADLRLIQPIRIAGSGAWSPVNTGTSTQPVIQDIANGIDIPAGEQIVVDLEVVLRDTPGNTPGTTFRNTASFTYNAIDGDETSRLSGPPGTTADMTIVGPEPIEVTKTGPVTMVVGTPGSYVLDTQNAGQGAAWNLRLVDQLPDPTPGGHLRRRADGDVRAGVRVGRLDAGFGCPRSGYRLRRQLPRGADVRARGADAVGGGRRRTDRAAHRPLRRVARRRYAGRGDAHERRRGRRVGECGWNEPTDGERRADLHAHTHQRNRRHARSRGRAHRRDVAARDPLRQDRRQPHDGPVARDERVPR